MTAMNERPWFEIQEISLRFGGLQVLDAVSLHV